ncbi:MAG TPA: hypothetical protein VF637_00825 [Sphingomicrobium sp.]
MLKFALSIAASGILAAALTSGPAQAQSTSRGEIIVYGEDPCPRSADDEVVVCRRLPAEQRYRIPEVYRPVGTRQQSQSWSARSRAMTSVGATGTNTCSPVGPGGWTGCLQQQVRQANEELKEDVATETAPTR